MSYLMQLSIAPYAENEIHICPVRGCVNILWLHYESWTHGILTRLLQSFPGKTLMQVMFSKKI